eukprot:11201250-Lingulodinium_polyedra.AAC.1
MGLGHGRNGNQRAPGPAAGGHWRPHPPQCVGRRQHHPTRPCTWQSARRASGPSPGGHPAR